MQLRLTTIALLDLLSILDILGVYVYLPPWIPGRNRIGDVLYVVVVTDLYT